MTLIGLTAFAKSGKTTVANLLKDSGFIEVALAGKLKDVCSQVFRIPREDFDDQSKKEVPFKNPPFISTVDVAQILSAYRLPVFSTMGKHEGMFLNSPRHIAQYVGTEILRAIDVDIHIKSAIADLDPHGKYVFSDVRFPNEAAFIKSAGGTLIGIKRDSVFPTDLASVHESESYITDLLSKSDRLLLNNSSMAEFEELVIDMIKDFDNRTDQ